MAGFRAALLAVLLALVPYAAGADTAPPFEGFASTADEIAVGRGARAAILAQFGGETAAPKFKRYVATLGEALARGIATKDMPFTFTVLDSPVVAAFATPGGFHYVTAGLAALADSEAELAAILAHEIAHHVAQHYPRRDRKTLVAGLQLAGLGNTGDRTVGEVLATGALPAFTRDEELDADTLAVRILARAGHDTAALPRMLSKIAAEAKLQASLRGDGAEAVDPFSWLAVHPLWDGRVARARETAERDDGGAREPSRDAYLDAIDGLSLGGDPKRGRIEGRTFIDPAARVRFEAPPGFHLFVLPHGVIGFGPRGARLVFDIARDTPGGSAEQHLATSWADGGKTAPVEAIEVGGLEAAATATRGRTDAGEADVRLVAIRGDGGTFYRFAFATPPERTASLSPALRRATYSFRRLSEAEAGTTKSLVLRVITIGPGDTIESLAQRMPFAANQRERFAVLNGLGPSGRLAPGLRAKIVSAAPIGP